MPLYTFIMDYAGGTYVSQVQADGPDAGCIAWAKSIEVKGIGLFGEKSKQRLVQAMMDEDNHPILLSGLTNVWCIDAILPKGFALINFVQTEQ